MGSLSLLELQKMGEYCAELVEGIPEDAEFDGVSLYSIGSDLEGDSL